MDYFLHYPPIPEKYAVEFQDMSPHTQGLIKRYNLSHRITPKLVTDLRPKKGFKCHLKYLKLLLSLGVVITNITRAVR